MGRYKKSEGEKKKENKEGLELTMKTFSFLPSSLNFHLYDMA